jgi:hypothetical protein
MDFGDIGWGGVDWIDMAQDRDRWKALVNTVMNYLNPCLVHPVALAINKKNETPLLATVFVVLSILLHVSAYIGHLQVLRIQNVKRTAECNGSVTITY